MKTWFQNSFFRILNLYRAYAAGAHGGAHEDLQRVREARARPGLESEPHHGVGGGLCTTRIQLRPTPPPPPRPPPPPPPPPAPGAVDNANPVATHRLKPPGFNP
jgi:hypothetical protein